MFKLSDLTTKSKSFAKEEDGAYTPLSILFILGSLTALGVAVDYANAIRDREAMQVAANSAALAAVIDLPNKDDAIAAGVSIAALNLAQSGNESAIGQADVQVGNLNASSGAFVPDEEPYNAVNVCAVRAVDRGNQLITNMARLAGRESYEFQVCAMAGTSSAPCSSGGFFSNSEVESGSNNDYLNGFCLYGRQGVKIGSDTFFEDGTKVEMPPSGRFTQSGNNRGVEDFPYEASYDLSSEYNAVPGIVSNLQDMNLSDVPSIPDWVFGVPIEVDKIEDKDVPDLLKGRLYIVDDVADLGSDQTIEDIAIVARKEVKIGSNNNVRNVFFATMDKILIGSNNTFADTNFCDLGTYDSWFYSGSNIEFGSNNLIRGLHMVAMDQLKLGSDVRGVAGVRGVAQGKIDYGSADTLSGCGGGVGGASGGGSYALIR